MIAQNKSASLSDEAIIEAAVDSAIKKTFAILGVDIDKPESVEAFREDLRFGRKLRRMSDHGTMAMVSVVIGGILLAFWYGIKAAASTKI